MVVFERNARAVPVELHTEEYYRSLEYHKSDKKERLQLMASLNGRFNAFATNETDEDTLTLEGRKLGFFKTLAPPVLPFQAFDRLDILVTLQQDISGHIATNPDATYEEALKVLTNHADEKTARLATQALDIHIAWSKKCVEQPLWMQEMMERTFADQIDTDRQLQTIFKQEGKIEGPPVAQAAELVQRLMLATNLLNPFYSMEGLVDDKQTDSPLNPIRESQKHLDSPIVAGGELESLFNSLPILFKDIFDADEKLSDENISWDAIKRFTKDMFSNDDMLVYSTMISDLSWRTSTSPENIIFSIWKRVKTHKEKSSSPRGLSIHASAEDAKQTAEALMKPTTSETNEQRLVKTAKKMNALFSVHNAMPGVEGPDNFEGRSLNYASVCDTAVELLQFIENHPDIWNAGFREHFQRDILPQIKAMRHSSAQGRVLLQLFDTASLFDEAFSTELQQVIEANNTQDEIITKLCDLKMQEWIRPLGQGIQPRATVGGKTKGIEHTLQTVVEAKTAPGVEIKSGFVNAILQSAPHIWHKIRTLDFVTEEERLIELCRSIESDIMGMEFSEELYQRLNAEINRLGGNVAVRSSARDEDPDETIHGRHYGIYRTVRITPEMSDEDRKHAILDSIASYFSQGAIEMRRQNNNSHLPGYSLLIQKYMEGYGGVTKLIQHNGTFTIATTVSDSPERVTQMRNHITVIEKESDSAERTTRGQEREIPVTILDSLDTISTKLHKLKHKKDIELEWVAVDGEVLVLQSKAFHVERHEDKLPFEPPSRYIVIDPDTNFGALLQVITEQTDGSVGLIFSEKFTADLIEEMLNDILYPFVMRANANENGKFLHQGHIAEVLKLKQEQNEIFNQTAHVVNLFNSYGIRSSLIDTQEAAKLVN